MSGVRFEEREDGVYLVVTPDAEVTLSDLLSQVREKGIEESDEKALQEALEGERGRPVRIADSAPPSEPAQLRLRISEDAMRAEISVLPPQGRGAWPTEEEVRAFLQEEKVLFGIKEDLIPSLTRPGSERSWFVIAEGQPPVHGKDGELVFKIETVLSRDLEAAKIDLRDLGTIVNITKDREILEKIPPTESADGTDVGGRTVKARKGRDPRLPVGSNVRLSDDGLHLLADADGHLSVKEDRISVLPLFEVSGDVDFSVGNIDFLGAVEIKGTVREDFVVKAGGDIVVKGVVEGATLECQGNMHILVGVRGMGKAQLLCKGTLRAGYLDQCNVRCEQDVIIEKGALRHCNISCRGKVLVTSDKKGQVVGGRIQAGTEVQAVSLGGEMGTKTFVSVGHSPELVEERKKQTALLKEMTTKLHEIMNNISFLKKLEERGALDEARRVLLVKLTKARFQLEAQQHLINERLASLEEEIERCRQEGVVRVRGTCYPGVTISIRGISHIVREEMKFVRFVLDQGEVRVLPFN